MVAERPTTMREIGRNRATSLEVVTGRRAGAPTYFSGVAWVAPADVVLFGGGDNGYVYAPLIGWSFRAAGASVPNHSKAHA